MRKVCEVLKPVARQCVLVSADFAAVHHVRQVSPYRIGWRLSEYTNTAALKCEALAPDYLFCDHQLLTANSSKLWRGPWQWVVYDVGTAQLALEPDNGSYVDSLGWTYYQLGRHEQARSYLERAVRLEPADATLQEHLGDVYVALGQKERAREAYQRALELADDNAEQVRRKLERLQEDALRPRP